MTSSWNRALVTGASSGIGQELARQLAAAGTDLVVVARDTERLEALKAELAVDVEVLTADLSELTQIQLVEHRLANPDRPIDLLINNAGFGRGGPFIENDREVATDVMTVNMVAVLRLAHAAAETMSARYKRTGQRGGILNVSSMAGDLVAPNSAVYSATKAFVTSLSESIHQELADDGVAVTAVLPGFTRTEFQERAEVDTSDFPSWIWNDAADVAAQSLSALDRNQPRLVTGRLNKAWGAISRTLPTATLRAAGRAAMKRENANANASATS